MNEFKNNLEKNRKNSVKENRMGNEKNNDEKSIKDSVKNSAENIKIPESISPEKMREKLETFRSEQLEEISNGITNKSNLIKKTWKSKRTVKFLATAASFVLILAAALHFHEQDVETSLITSSKDTTTLSTTETDNANNSFANTEKDNNTASSKIADSSKLSEFYYTTTYEDIKGKVKKTWEESMMVSDQISYNGTEKQSMEESAELATEVAIDTADSGSSRATGSYSTTNLQVEGVDEGDIIKTDGNYFYILTTEGQIRIVDVKTLKETSTISNKINDNEVQYSEIYVADKHLVLAGNVYTSSLKKQAEDTYYMDSNSQTILVTYDISDAKNPKLIGSVYQDGTYRTSRKIGDYIYLFSDYSYYPDTLYPYDSSSKEESSSSKYNTDDTNIVPTVNQKTIAEDSIYIPMKISSCSYLVISSVNLREPSKTLDEKSIMQSGNDFHITKESIYVLQTDWVSNHIQTNIIRFSFQNAKISPVDAASLDGELTDSFAINESNSYLRVLLTDWSSTSSTQTNSVYVLDNKMKVVGKIKNLAPGETIYSARFMGDIGYFVTYRNTDPLFSVDFSDPENPKIIGELKITGFSEYLHFYGKDKLFGLGRETDPNTGEFLGIKLSMFDISNPKDVKEEKKIVLKGIDDCDALDNYKAILIDDEKNLIGFAVQDYKNGVYNWEYLVFSYDKNEGFVKKLDYGFTENSYSLSRAIRGIYIDSLLYIVRDSEIVSFDMEEGFKQVRKVNLG